MTRFGSAFLLIAAVHASLTYMSVVLEIGWTMAVLDSGGHAAPFGLQIVHVIAGCLSLPLLWPMARGALAMGFADPVSDAIYFPLPLLNSLFVSAVVIMLRGLIRKSKASHAS
jgi:hypothetical protein